MYALLINTVAVVQIHDRLKYLCPSVMARYVVIIVWEAWLVFCVGAV